MRYKVVFVKLNELSSNGAQPKPDKDNLIRSPKPKLQGRENMIILKNQDKLVERKNALNKMVNTETPEDFNDNGQKETFQYQLPRVRASFTLKVAPDSTTADLPERTVDPPNPSNEENSPIVKCDSNIPSSKAPILENGPHLPNTNLVAPDKLIIRDSRARLPTQPSVIQCTPKIHKPIIANRSNHNVINDDKDFEIPLEESLKAVEDFIKREKELSKWHIGEDVLAKWKGNGLYYKAKIMEIFPSGIIIVLFDSYDITEEIDYKDLCKFIRKTSNFKKKGCPQERLKEETEVLNKGCVKKHTKAKKQKMLWKSSHFNSVFKRSDMLRRKLLLTYRKRSHNLSIIKSKRSAQKTEILKNS